MKGSIQLHSAKKYWLIVWYHNGHHEKFYNDFLHSGQKFWVMHPNSNKCMGHDRAERCLTVMRNDWEAYCRGERAFELSKYRGRYTDVIPYMETWLKSKDGKIMPGTLKPYTIAVTKHLIPFFERHHVQLHEIQKDTISLLLTELSVAPKTKQNIINVLHTCLVDAYESNRIPRMPGFPKKGDYQIINRPIIWITEDEKDRIFSHIPEEHLPIFWLLRLSWRREGEAMALLKADYDHKIDALIFHRGISDRKIVEKVKDGEIHAWPCDERFRPYLQRCLTRKDFSPYMFICKTSRMEGNRYTREILMRIWKSATDLEKIKIDIHRGLRTSGASSAINEFDWSLDEAQAHGQWADKKTLTRFYGRYDLDRIRALQAKKIIPLKKREQK